ncbi:MAG: TolB-like 6-bladed beta-propeller domain-containing protein [Prevotellaceae bacterium]|jgi:hypothetical protein|nr:TolB-like 6-bladed beta-propeller domain-containing protein [Prevotellaceae bacterium]
MKRLFDYLKTSVTVLLFSTCTEQQAVFDALSRDLKSEVLMDRDSSLMIGDTDYITMVNNSLYIRDIHEGFCYTKYDTRTREAYRFVMRGQGPGEMLMPTYTVSSIKINDTAYIGLYESNLHKIFLYREDSLTDSAQNNFYKVIPCGDGSIHDLTMSAWILNDSVILGGGIYKTDACKIYRYDPAQETYTGQGTYMKVFTGYEKGNEEWKRVLADGNKFDLSPDKSHIARITQFGGLIEAYRVNGMELTPLFGKKYFNVMNNPDLKHNNDSRYGYIDVTVSDNKIYALYCGNQILHEPKEDPFQSKTVHVYAWNGESLETLLLDKYVSGIAVNNEDTELYALSSAEKDLLLFRLINN